MSSLLALPPRFLLPAWSSAQLSQLRVLHTTTPRSRAFYPSHPHPKNGESTASEVAASREKDFIRKKASRGNPSFDARNDSVQLQQLNRHDASKDAALAPGRPPPPRRCTLAGEDEADTGLTKSKRGRGADAAQVLKHAAALGRYPSVKRVQVNGMSSKKPAVVNERLEVPEQGISATPDLPNSMDKAQPRLSLFEELFPAEATRDRERHTPSLFQELFPSESKQTRRQKNDSTLKQGDLRLDLPYSPPPDAPPRRRKETILDFVPSPLQKMHWQQDRLTIMVVMGLSPFLDEADFQRLLPRGEHIPEWRSPGDVLRVITSRDEDTLTPRALHYLIFANPTMAKAYKSYLEHVHALARAHTPTSLLSDPLPPRGYFIQGTNIHQLIQDYTLCAPSQELQIRVLLPPYDRRLRTLLENQGYAALQRTHASPKAGRSALLWVEGYMPDIAGIRAMLSVDGRQRGLAWGAMTPEGGVVELSSEGPSRATPQRRSQLRTAEDHRTEENHPETGADEELMEEDHHAKDEEDSAADRSHSKGRDGSGNAKGSSSRLSPPRWLLTFRDEAEARRFVRAWHRQAYPFAHRDEQARLERGRGQQLDIVPTVHAQYVW